MPTKRDYYEILGIPKTASADEIKKNHRRLARKFHPDTNRNDPSAEAKFKEVQEAYDILSDAKKRTAYDQFGHAGVSSAHAADAAAAAAAAGRGAGGFRYSTQTPGGATVDYGDVDLNDLFESILGDRAGGRRGRARGGPAGGGGFDPFGRQTAAQAPPGDNIRYPVTISFEQAIRGTSVDVHLHSTDRALSETLSIKIPPGVADGKKIAARGKGNPGPTGVRGDLIIEIHVTPHDYFRLEGSDVLLDLPISLAEAVNGATISVPTVDGPVDLRVPAGISSGKRLRIRDHGVPLAGGGRGDQFCRILIQVPSDLSDAEKQQITQIEKGHSYNPRKAVKW